jgi:hypothetical protein
MKEPFPDSWYVAILEGMPDWTGMHGSITEEDRRVMMTRFEPFLKLHPEDIKRIGNLYNNKVRNGLITEQILVLLVRAYFDIPMSVKDDDASGSHNPFFGGVTKEFKGLPWSSQSALWPVAEWHGKLVVSGTMSGSGPLPFFFDREFDTFLQKYKRRQKID